MSVRDGGIDQPLPKPYLLTEPLCRALDRVLRSVVLFDAGEGLHLITCRKGPGAYTLGVFNNTWRPLPLQIISRCGAIESIRELTLDLSEKGALGYTPEGVNPATLETNRSDAIAGGDVRIFAVTVRETNVVEIVHRKPPARPHGRFLPLRQPCSLKEAILVRPTFFEHFDGVLVDGRYLWERERRALAAEVPWLKRQGLRIAVDLSPAINLYPGLRLVNNATNDYAASLAVIRDVLAKMEILGARDLVLSLHRHPENNFTDEQSRAAFEAALKQLAAAAAGHRVTLHLRLAAGKPPWSLAEAAKLMDRVGAPHLKLAPSTALLWHRPSAEEASLLKGRMGLLLVAGRQTDLAGAVWDTHTRLATVPDRDVVAGWLALDPKTPVALDAVFGSPDEEVLDALLVRPPLPHR